MALNRYSPDLFSSLENQMSRFFGDVSSMLPRQFGMAMPSFSNWAGNFIPSTDVVERPNEMLVQLNLPGLRKEDVKVNVIGNQLVVSGETKREEEREQGFWRTREREYGRFERRVPIPEGVKTDQINAKFDNGVMEISLPRVEGTHETRSITIQ